MSHSLSPSEHASDQTTESTRVTDPDYAPAYFRKGVAAFQLGNLADAEVALTRAARLDPSLPVKKWLRKLRAEVAALLGETTVPPPPPSVPRGLRETEGCSRARTHPSKSARAFSQNSEFRSCMHEF